MGRFGWIIGAIAIIAAYGAAWYFFSELLNPAQWAFAGAGLLLEYLIVWAAAQRPLADQSGRAVDR
ncbi:hypothetical protein LV457_16525 [Mycobacterium sp. MYCO198283]|uniref:hypothetical protein n=1 Tax=Mycobacterium sp. MYCO198283 TaxID=2883505 RepID=UPI001E53EF84|nr:hypothetical protein [Mycobacterium sp. MYCO198283]MCG5433882.1 hypothetical protein [Mycobacterium sp. MYCO198283]